MTKKYSSIKTQTFFNDYLSFKKLNLKILALGEITLT